MPFGYITYYNIAKQFGFIDCPELGYYDIYFHRTYLDSSYKNIFSSDYVEFELNFLKETDLTEAHNVKFIRNSTLGNLQNDYINNKIKRGFLKRFGEDYYVKDSETYMFIKLRIARNEIDLNKSYINNINRIINYRIVVFSTKNKIRAINTDRQFSEEFISITSGKICDAKILKKVKDGYRIIVEENILGFIPDTKANKLNPILYPEQQVKVKCVSNKDSAVIPSFEIV